MTTEGELFTYLNHLRRVLVFFFVMALVSLVGFLETPEMISPAGLALLLNITVWALWCIDIYKRRSEVIGKLSALGLERIRSERVKDVS